MQNNCVRKKLNCNRVTTPDPVTCQYEFHCQISGSSLVADKTGPQTWYFKFLVSIIVPDVSPFIGKSVIFFGEHLHAASVTTEDSKIECEYRLFRVASRPANVWVLFLLNKIFK